jgi:hypothetical protein
MKHFKPYELVSRKIYFDMNDSCLSLFEPKALIMLDDFHEFIHAVVTVNNWFWGGDLQHRGARSLQEQIEINPGHPHGMHVYDLEKGIKCRAFDMTISGMRAEDVRHIILTRQNDSLLSEITRLENHVSWVHIDCMPLPAGIERIHLFEA